MLTNEERIAAMHSRAEQLEKERQQKFARRMQVSSVAAGFVLVILLAAFLSDVTGRLDTDGMNGNMNASILSGTAAGTVVIAIIAFMLGIAVTVFCYKIKRK